MGSQAPPSLASTFRCPPTVALTRRPPGVAMLSQMRVSLLTTIARYQLKMTAEERGDDQTSVY